VPVEYKEKTDKDNEEIMEDFVKFGGYAVNFVLIGSLIYVLYRISGGSGTKNSQGMGGGFGDIF